MSDEKRPILKLPLSQFEVLLELTAMLSVWFNIVVIFKFWKVLKEKIPQHFNAAGVVDSWGKKSTLLSIPIMMVLFYIIITVLEKYPQVYNYIGKITEENAEIQYRVARQMLMCMKTVILLFFTYVQWRTIQIALGNNVGIGVWFLPSFLISVFAVMSYYIYKMLKNSQVM